jgi:phosphatidylethanolamine/phosphatidyl-N-methylethanolamine N-methyltransferase
VGGGWFEDLRKRFGGRQSGGATAAVLDDAHIVAAYARWAPIYDPIFGVITAVAQRATVAVLNRLPDGRLLELGVGTGITLPRYRRGHRITGIDLSPDMLERARKRVARRGLANVEALHEMDAARLTMADGSFDAGVAMFVMTVVPEPQRVLSELIRVVRPGGRVVLVNHFSAEGGVRMSIEKWLTRFAASLGWNPDFPLATVLGRPQLRLIEKKRLAPFGLYTLLVFERL